MLLLNSSLAFLFFPDPSEEAHPEIRDDAEAGSQAGGQVRSSHCLCWGSLEVSLLLPCKEEVIPWVTPGKGLASSTAASTACCKLTACQKSAAS